MTEKDPIQINARDGERQVVFTGDQENRFVRSCEWTEAIARFGISREVWLRELHSLTAHVGAWAETQSDRVAECLAAWRDNQLAILVAPLSDHYDFELAAELTRLDIELAERFPACPCDVLQIPNNVTKFRDADTTMTIYGDPAGTTQSEVA